MDAVSYRGVMSTYGDAVMGTSLAQCLGLVVEQCDQQVHVRVWPWLMKHFVIYMHLA